ncbi:MAG: SRPBCC domain-containing protein [Steroidobacteraceae bacterium]|jgi:uncharacterized protein YndB with AHSA1/START domain|nr:SRPBCC domain-containing protein [Steroidobacteraceae bacterium]
MSRGYAQFVEIHVPPAVAWAAFTEEPWLRRWYGVDATVDPHRGGAFRVRLRDGRVRDATIDVWEPNRRLRLIYFPDADHLAAGDPGDAGPVVEDVLFDTKPGTRSTIVRVMGSGVPDGKAWDGYYTRLRLGWAYLLHELKRALEAGVAPDGAPKAAAGPAGR